MKICRIVIRPVMTHGLEFWTWKFKKPHVLEMSVVEIRMLRWMSGKNIRHGYTKMRARTLRLLLLRIN